MNSLLLSLVLVSGGTNDLVRPQDGTLIFLENSKKVVQEVTDSCITHVAMVINEKGVPWVYDAEPPRVRRVSLMTFYREIGERNRDNDEAIRIWLLPPNKKFSRRERAKMKSYLEKQVGRRYSIKNYVRDVKGDGIHCAELTANALKRSGRLSFDNCQTLSPGALISGCASAYSLATEALISLSYEDKRSWCKRSRDWWANAWKWCKWSSGECWTWCHD